MGSEQRQLRILLVEDNYADIFLVQEAMRHEGLPVDMEVAEDGEQAIAIVKRIDDDPTAQTPDCFLIDLNIPRRSGDEVLKSIRASVRSGKVPVIVITSSHAAADRERSFELGATDFFVKPFHLDSFRALAKLVQARATSAG